MAQWRIKEMSDLTKISVRMLRYYDKTGLLKPSVRSANGYRWYTEQDLATLQQILALKFFGFNLSQIKTMLQHKLGIREHLQAQRFMLHEQIEQLTQSQEALNVVLKRLGSSGTPDWNDLISLIERYRMAEDVKKTWFGKNLDKAQLAEWLEIRSQHPKEYEKWEELIAQVNDMKFGAPESAQAQRMLEQMLTITKTIKDTFAQQRKLNAGILRSVRAGKISSMPLTPEAQQWFSKASLIFWLGRWNSLYQEILKNLKADPAGAEGKKVAQEWRNLITEQLVGTSPDLVIGTMLWQDMARQKSELEEQKTLSTAQDMVKKIHVELFFNPEALSWIEVALNSH